MSGPTLPGGTATVPVNGTISGIQYRWGAPSVSMFSMALLLVALIFAYIMKNDNLLILLTGVIATNATTIVNYYVGSSSGSQTKDATIASQLVPPPVVGANPTVVSVAESGPNAPKL